MNRNITKIKKEHKILMQAFAQLNPDLSGHSDYCKCVVCKAYNIVSNYNEGKNLGLHEVGL